MTGALVGIATVSLGVSPAGAADRPDTARSTVETVPGTHSGDSIDDPAIWVHPTQPARSLVMANDKQGAFETYDLRGDLVQRITFGDQFWGNVDVRQGVRVGPRRHDLVGVVQGRGVRFYSPDPDTRRLSPITEDAAPIGVSGEGFCLYESPVDQQVYGIVITRGGKLRQFVLRDPDGDGRLQAAVVRTIEVGSEAEGCVADDTTGALYVGEEDVALWRYDAEPDGGSARRVVDVVADDGGQLAADIEGVTLVEQAGGAGYVVVSAQNVDNPRASYFGVYRRGAGNAFVRNVRVTDGVDSDDCDRTDGIAASSAALGPAFPQGVFVCQDNSNYLPGSTGNQNLKLTPLERIVDLDGTAPTPTSPTPTSPPPTPPPSDQGVAIVGTDTANMNSTEFSARVPAATRADDLILLFDSANRTAPVDGPGAGWTRVGREVDNTHATTVWARRATAADAGRRVRLDTDGVWTKTALTLAVYRGADPADPLAAVASAASAGDSAEHTTPRATSDGPVLRVSYWSDKSSTTTGWTAPAGEATRATTTGSGGGRVSSLLTDRPALVPAGTHGGVTATASDPATKATTWTLLLQPAG